MVTNLTQYLDKQYHQNKDKIVLCDEENTFTFGEIYTFANYIAKRIHEAAEHMLNKPVIIFLPKGYVAYSVLLGILYSGNYYVPLDIKMPVDRLKIIVDLLQSEVAVACPQTINYLDKAGFCGTKIILSEADCFTSDVDCMIPRWKDQIIDTDPAYVLFTSGSTGIPKGVVISHRAVIDYVEWQCKELKMDETTILANQAPFYFDASMPDIFTPLAIGCTLTLIPETLFLFPNKLIEYLNLKKVNTLIWVPSALMTLSKWNCFSKTFIENLRLVMFCGEVMPVKHLNIWRKYYPEVCFVNLYGPTEAAYACTYYRVNKSFIDSQTLPIGKACGNLTIMLLDDNRKPVVQGAGELCIRGSCLASGYYKDKKRTDEVFIQDPTNCYYTQTIYCSGDIAQYNEEGDLEYIGRKDFQIKHQGYRIELGEIEAAAYGLSEVKQCCAIYDESAQNIVLYCVLNFDISPKEIFMYLQKKLPRYMLPKDIQLKDDLPLNANGKIDRLTLKNSYRTLRKGKQKSSS